MIDPVHSQGLRLCLGTFRTSAMERLYVDAHKPRMIYNKYMKLFNARPNANRTFCHRIKHFLTASNNEFSDILV